KGSEGLVLEALASQPVAPVVVLPTGKVPGSGIEAPVGPCRYIHANLPPFAPPPIAIFPVGQLTVVPWPSAGLVFHTTSTPPGPCACQHAKHARLLAVTPVIYRVRVLRRCIGHSTCQG